LLHFGNLNGVVVLKELKKLHRSQKSTPYCSENELLVWVCDTLPTTEKYRGSIIVQSGCVVMGAHTFGFLLVVYADSPDALFEFARLGVEMEDGVARSETLMVAYTLR